MHSLLVLIHTLTHIHFLTFPISLIQIVSTNGTAHLFFAPTLNTIFMEKMSTGSFSDLFWRMELIQTDSTVLFEVRDIIFLKVVWKLFNGHHIFNQFEKLFLLGTSLSSLNYLFANVEYCRITYGEGNKNNWDDT